MATFDELRLQQLLKPFDNTGVLSTSNAVPMINNIPMINTNQIFQNLQNQDLVNKIIADNQKKTKMIIQDDKVITVPISSSDVGSAPLRFATDDTAPFFFPNNNQMVPLKKPVGIMSVADDDLEASAIPEFEEGELKQSGGIGDLFRALLGFVVPGANFFLNKGRDALTGIKSLNQRLRDTDFAKSRNLADYLDIRKYGGYDARERAREKTMREARAIQKQLDLRTATGKYDDGGDRGRGQIPTRSETKSTKRSTSQSGMAADRARSRNEARTSSRVSGGRRRAYGL